MYVYIYIYIYIYTYLYWSGFCLVDKPSSLRHIKGFLAGKTPLWQKVSIVTTQNFALTQKWKPVNQHARAPASRRGLAL